MADISNSTSNTLVSNTSASNKDNVNLNIADDFQGISVVASNWGTGIEGTYANDHLYANGHTGVAFNGGEGNDYINLSDTIKAAEEVIGATFESSTPITTVAYFYGNLKADIPIITSIDGSTTPEGRIYLSDTSGISSAFLELSDGTYKTVTSGSYQIGHSVPVTMTLKVEDSLGKIHSVPVQLEKVNGNTWQISLNDEKLGMGAVYIPESDGTYTKVTIATGYDNTTYSCIFVNFNEDGSYLNVTSNSTSSAEAITGMFSFEHNYKAIYATDKNGNTYLEGYEKNSSTVNAAEDRTVIAGFWGLTQYGGDNTTNIDTDQKIGIRFQPSPTFTLNFAGNLNANAPLITSIDGETTVEGRIYVGANLDTSVDTNKKSAFLGFSDGTYKTVTSGEYQIGHSAPVTVTMQIQDSEGMTHDIDVLAEKVHDNCWQIKLPAAVITENDNENGATVNDEVHTIEENDCTYTSVRFYGASVDTQIPALYVNFNEDGSYLNITSDSSSTKATITANILLQYNRSASGDPMDEGTEINGAEDTTTTMNFSGLSQFVGVNNPHIGNTGGYNVVIEAAATNQISFTGNLTANPPLITSIDGETTVEGRIYVGTNLDTSIETNKKSAYLGLNNGRGITVTSGAYTIGHSIPIATILQVYDSEGMAHDISVLAEKVNDNCWQISLPAAIITGEGNENGAIVNSEVHTIEESDGTYTSIRFYGASVEDQIPALYVNFNEDGSYLNVTSDSSSTEATITANILLQYNRNASGDPMDEGTEINGAADTTITIDFSRLSQLNDSYSVVPYVNGGVAIQAGKTESLGFNVIEYSSGDGNDTVEGWREGDLIYLTDSTDYKAQVSGNDVILTVGTGTILIKDAKNKLVNVKNMNSKYTHNVYTEKTTIAAAVNNNPSTVILTGTNNADYVYDNDTYMIIETGNGNDTIKEYGFFNEIMSEDGDDYIRTACVNTITGGNGNDTIELTGGYNTIQYSNGDGNDVIIDYNDTDVIKILEDSSYSTTKSGNDVIIKVSSGRMTLKNAKGKTLNISGGTYDSTSGDDVIEQPLPTGLTYNKDKKALTASNKFTGSEIDLNNYASTVVTLNAASAKSAQNLIGNDNNNLIKGSAKNDTLSGGDGDDTLTGGKGKDVFICDGQGDDVITDYTAGQDTIMIANDETITGSSLKGNDVILTVEDSNLNSIGTLTIKNGKGKVVNIVKSMTDTPLSIVYGDNSATMNIATNDGSVISSTDDKINAPNLVTVIDASKSTKDKSISAADNEEDIYIKGGSKNDTLQGGTGDDTLTGGKGNDIFIYDGQGDDVITDYTAGQDTIMIASDETITGSSLKGKDVILTVEDSNSNSIGTLTIKNSKGKSVNIIKSSSTTDNTFPAIYGNGDATINIATSDSTSIIENNDIINVRGLVTMIDASKSNKVKYLYGDYSHSYDDITIIKGSSKNDTIYPGYGKVTIYGNAGDDYISGNGGSNVLYGGAGNDTLVTYGWDHTVTGGAGKDLFICEKCHTTITDYTAGQDTIKLGYVGATEIDSVSIKGNDLIFVLNSQYDRSQNITLKNVVTKDKKGNINGKKITVTDRYGNTTSQVYGTPTLNVADGDGDTIDASNKINNEIVKVVDASKRKKAVTLIGNDGFFKFNGSLLKGGSGADSITSSYFFRSKGDNTGDTLIGNAGNDTIVGYFGDDILTGGKGNDVFIYNGYGKDTITDYTVAQDIIKLNYCSAANYSVNGKDVIFNVDEDNFLTVKNGKDKKMTVIDSSGTVTSIFNDITEKVFAKTDKDTLYNATTDSDVITIDATKLTKAIYITGNDNDNTIKGSAKNDTIDGGSGNDLLTGGKGNDLFIYSGGNDTITDYTVGQDKIKINTFINAVLADGKDLKIRTKNGAESLIVKNAAGKKVTLIDKDEYTATVAFTEKNWITYLTDESNDFYTTAVYVNVDASKRKKDITLIGTDNVDSFLKGGSGSDLIASDYKNDTLTGGKGNDTFQCASGGDDVITDYTAGQDIISISKDHSITNSSIAKNKKDIILTVGDDNISDVSTITIKNGKGKQITINDRVNTGTQIYGEGESTLMVTADIDVSTMSNIELVTMVDASKAKSAIKITNGNTPYTIKGSNYADSLIGGTADDTFIGGKGNDTLSGSAGADIFVYTSGDGNDVIVDFTSNDKIKLGNKSTTINEKKSGVSGDDYILTIGKNTIKLIDAANTAITVVDSKGNSKTYNSQASYLEREYFTDENFSSTELDSILDNSSNLISNDYNYDFNYTLNKQLSQTLVTNSPKQPK